jgi:hypothetical protein
MVAIRRGTRPLIRHISASSFVDLAFSCTCSEVGWDLCAGKCARSITAWAPDVDTAPVRPRDPSCFQGLHGFSLTINDSNEPGKLLSLNEQIPRIEQMGFGHSSGTPEKQGRQRKNLFSCPIRGFRRREEEHDCVFYLFPLAFL